VVGLGDLSGGLDLLGAARAGVAPAWEALHLDREGATGTGGEHVDALLLGRRVGRAHHRPTLLDEVDQGSHRSYPGGGYQCLPPGRGRTPPTWWARALAAELGPYGIRVNTVAPALTLTDAVREATPEGFKQLTLERTPLGRLGEVDDVAGGIELLATDDARWLTGSYLVAGGGLYMP
jgi:Enoyl-(Acyl carrier protein) reductase